MRNAVRIDVSDNVATVLRDVSERERIGWGEGSGLVACESIPEGHKVALVDIARGEKVVKYNRPIGNSTEDIARGAHVHTHNLRTARWQQ